MVPPVSDTTGPGRRHWQAVSDPGLQETRSGLLSAVICQPLKRQNSSSPKLPQLPGDVVSGFHRLEKNVIFLFKEYYNYYHQASGHFTPNHTNPIFKHLSILPFFFRRASSFLHLGEYLVPSEEHSVISSPVFRVCLLLIFDLGPHPRNKDKFFHHFWIPPETEVQIPVK